MNDCWNVLFSHAEDFGCSDIESDRWLAVVSRSFREQRVRALALPPAASTLTSTWVDALDLADPAVPGIFNLRARRLKVRLARLEVRFVAIADAALRLRRTFVYSSGSVRPSVLDFLGWIRRLRAGDDPPAPLHHAFIRADIRRLAS